MILVEGKKYKPKCIHIGDVFLWLLTPSFNLWGLRGCTDTASLLPMNMGLSVNKY